MGGEPASATSASRWALISLGSLLSRIESGWSPACDAYPPSNDEWGVIRVSAVTSGRFDPSEAKRLPADLQPRLGLEIRAGDVLIARANGARSLVGVACQVAETRSRLMLSDKILRLVSDPDLAEPAFLAMLLSSGGVRRQIENLLNGSSGQNNISQTDIRGLFVPDVPIAEQRRIVAAHAAFERRIAAMAHVLNKLRAAESALADAALVGGRSDGTWPKHPLATVAAVSSGVTLGFEPVGDGTAELPYLRVANVLDGSIDTTDVKKVRILQSHHERFALRKGDLLLTEGGDLDKLGRGAVWYGRIDPCLHQNHVFRVRCGPQMSPDFLALYTASQAGRRYFQSVGKQTTNLASINSTQVKAMPIPVPPLEEQERLMAPIRAARTRAAALQCQIAKLRLTQQGLAEDLLSGRVRVPQA